MVSWKLVYTKQARKDAKKLASSGLKLHAQRLLDILAENPYQTPPPTTVGFLQVDVTVGRRRALTAGGNSLRISRRFRQTAAIIRAWLQAGWPPALRPG